MKIVDVRELHKLASDVNDRRLNDLADFLYDEIVESAQNGKFTYDRTFENAGSAFIDQIIVRMKDVFHGITIHRDIVIPNKLVFWWDLVDDEEMPPLIPVCTKHFCYCR
jgi:hypothetical protein